MDQSPEPLLNVLFLFLPIYTHTTLSLNTQKSVPFLGIVYFLYNFYNRKNGGNLLEDAKGNVALFESIVERGFF